MGRAAEWREGLSADICPGGSRGWSSRNAGLIRIMRNHSSVLFTAPKDIFSLLETPQGGCFSWLLGKRGAPQGIARVGVRRLGAARQHIKGSQGHQKRSLATSMSEGRAAGTSSGSGMREERQQPAEMSNKQRHQKTAPLQRRSQSTPQLHCS